jgi:hypothetical protein
MPSRNRISSNMTPTRIIDPPGAGGETLNFENARAVQALYVNDPQNLRRLEDRFGVKITTRDGWIKLDGPVEGIAKARDVFQQLHLAREKGLYIRKNEFNFAMDSVGKNSDTKLADLHTARLQISAKKPPIIPKSLQQKKYVESVKDHDLIFGIGPAGTGKTFLAMAMAVAALKNEEVTRIVLTRPAVEAGEALGFLPGDLQEKIFPYLRPLYDALNDMLENDEIQRYMDKASSRSPRSPTCAGARSATASSSSTRRRIPPPSRCSCSSPAWARTPSASSPATRRRSTCRTTRSPDWSRRCRPSTAPRAFTSPSLTRSMSSVTSWSSASSAPTRPIAARKPPA